jgi:hypothetical protein
LILSQDQTRQKKVKRAGIALHRASPRVVGARRRSHTSVGKVRGIKNRAGRSRLSPGLSPLLGLRLSPRDRVVVDLRKYTTAIDGWQIAVSLHFRWLHLHVRGRWSRSTMGKDTTLAMVVKPKDFLPRFLAFAITKAEKAVVTDTKKYTMPQQCCQTSWPFRLSAGRHTGHGGGWSSGATKNERADRGLLHSCGMCWLSGPRHRARHGVSTDGSIPIIVRVC